MTEQELRAQGRPGLFGLLKDQESEIIRLNDESQKLQQQLEDLLSSMSAVRIKPRRAVASHAVSAPQPEKDSPRPAEELAAPLTPPAPAPAVPAVSAAAWAAPPPEDAAPQPVETAAIPSVPEITAPLMPEVIAPETPPLEAPAPWTGVIETPAPWTGTIAPEEPAALWAALEEPTLWTEVIAPEEPAALWAAPEEPALWTGTITPEEPAALWTAPQAPAPWTAAATGEFTPWTAVPTAAAEDIPQPAEYRAILGRESEVIQFMELNKENLNLQRRLSDLLAAAGARSQNNADIVTAPQAAQVPLYDPQPAREASVPVYSDPPVIPGAVPSPLGKVKLRRVNRP